MTLLGAPVLKGSAQDAAIKHKTDDLSRAIERLTLLQARAFRFAIRIDSPIHFKRIDSNRFVL